MFAMTMQQDSKVDWHKIGRVISWTCLVWGLTRCDLDQMTIGEWIAVALYIAAIVSQVATGVFSGRLKRVEKEIETMQTKASEQASRIQASLGQTEIRLAVMSERVSHIEKAVMPSG